MYHLVRQGLCSSTPRGDGNRCCEPTPMATLTPWFMQLNPARGRKLLEGHLTMSLGLGLCSSTPRGDGNSADFWFVLHSLTRRFMQLNPARGRKRGLMPFFQSYLLSGLCSSTPRGDGNSHKEIRRNLAILGGLCSSIPRGDGNAPSPRWPA